MYLSIIIPAYNEEKRLPKTLFEINKYLLKLPYEYEIIVVNDGSKDKTGDIIKKMFSEIKNLKLINNKENHGKGFVVRQGMMEAKGKYRFFSDADNSTSIDQIKKMLPYLEKEYDIVIGSRKVKGAVITIPQPWHRILLGIIFNISVQVIVGLWGIWDTQCGFKALNAKAVKDILPRCRIDRWAFDPEILKIGKKLGYKIKEVPVVWANDPESKVKFKNMIKMGFDLFKIRYNFIIGKYNR